MQRHILKSVLVLQLLICSFVFVASSPSSAAAAISVEDISSLDVWLKADAITASDDDPVTTWTNSGDGADFTQSDVNYKPTYKTNVINSLPVVRFDGSNDFLDASIATSTEVTVFAVAANTRTTLNTVDVLVSSADAGGGSGFAVITSNQWTSNTQRQLLSEGSGISVTRKKNNATSPLTLDKDEFSLITYELSSVGSRSSLRLGQFTNGNFTGQHDLAEILVFDAQLSTAEKEAVLVYLSEKYDISITPSQRSVQTLTSGGEQIKGVMYWPKEAVTPDWWPAYEDGTITDAEITAELQNIKETLGINTVRVFLYYDLEYRKNSVIGFTDGAGTENAAMLAKVSRFIDLAAAEGIDVIPSLFQEMESFDPEDFGTGTTLADNLTYHQEYAAWLGEMFATKDNIPAILIMNEPDGFGAWADNARAAKILTWLRAIKTTLEAEVGDIPIWVNATTHDNVVKTIAGAPVGSTTIYSVSDAYAFNSFLWADNGYWEYTIPPVFFDYAHTNNPEDKPVVLTEFGQPSHYDDDGLVIANEFWNNPLGSRPTTPSTEATQKQAILEFSYWLEQKRIDGALAWSALDHPVDVYRDPFGLIDIDDTGKEAAPLFKRLFSGRFDANGEAPLSLMQGSSTGDSTINGVDGTTDLPAGLEVAAGESYTSEVLPYKLPLGTKLFLTQGTRPTSGGPSVSYLLRSGAVRKTLTLARDEARKRWTISVDGSLVAATEDNVDAGLSTSNFSLELRVAESGGLSVLVDGTTVSLFETSGSDATDTSYTDTLSTTELKADVILQIAAAATQDLEVTSAVVTGSVNYPVVSMFHESMIDVQKLITNSPSGFSAVRASDRSINVTSTPQWGTQTVQLITSSESNPVAEFSINFDSTRNWTNLSAGSSSTAALVHYTGGASAIPGNTTSTFTLYVPKAANDTHVYICPNASSIEQVTRSCANGYARTESDDAVSVVSIDSKQYWKVTGLTGTGGLSYNANASTQDSSGSSSSSSASNTSNTAHCSAQTPSKAPMLYAALPVDQQSIELYFTDAGDPYTEYQLRFRREDSDWEYGDLNFAAAGDRHKVVHSLGTHTTYVFQLQAVHDCATSGWSNEFSGQIGETLYSQHTAPVSPSAKLTAMPKTSARSGTAKQTTESETATPVLEETIQETITEQTTQPQKNSVLKWFTELAAKIRSFGK